MKSVEETWRQTRALLSIPDTPAGRLTFCAGVRHAILILCSVPGNEKIGGLQALTDELRDFTETGFSLSQAEAHHGR